MTKTQFRGLNELLNDVPANVQEDGIHNTDNPADSSDPEEGAKGGEENEGDEGQDDNQGQEKRQVKVTAEGSKNESEQETEEERRAREAVKNSTKDEEGTGTEGEEDSEELNFFQKASQITGYEVEGDFEESEDGLLEYTKQLASAMAEEAVQAELGKNPIVKTFIDFLNNGGSPEKFFQVQHPDLDYAKVTIPADDDDSARKMIEHYYQQKGLNNVQVARLVAMAEESGTLHSDAGSYLAEMRQAQADTKIKQIEEQKQLAIKQAEEDKKYWEGIQAQVMQGKIGGITIPEKERPNFYNWLTVPVNKQGQTQRELDFAALSEEDQMVIEYLVHNKFTALYKGQPKTTTGSGNKKVSDAVSTMLNKSNKKKEAGAASVSTPETKGAKATFKPLTEIL